MAGAQGSAGGFPQCTRNQGARADTRSTKNKSQFFAHPSQPVLNKCSSCPCTKPMTQIEKLRLREVGSQSRDGAEPGLTHSLHGSEPREQCSLAQFLQSLFQAGKGPSLSCTGPVRAQDDLHSISYPCKLLPGPVLSTLHIQTQLSHHSLRGRYCATPSAHSRAKGPQWGRHTAWNPSICRGPKDALTGLTGSGSHSQEGAASQGAENSGAWRVSCGAGACPLPTSILIPSNAIPSRSFSPPGMRLEGAECSLDPWIPAPLQRASSASKAPEPTPSAQGPSQLLCE